MSYGRNHGQEWSGRDHNRRSHPYQLPVTHPHFRPDPNHGYQERYDARNQHEDRYDRRGHHSDYNRQDYHQHDHRGSHPGYHASSSYSHSSLSSFNDRNNGRYSDSHVRRNDFNHNQRNDHQRNDHQRQSLPELRSDLRPNAQPEFRPSIQSNHGNGAQFVNSYSGPPVDLQMRTLRVNAGNGWDFDKRITKDILQELFIQVGPVRNIVLKPSFAFIEFQDADSVSYALAAMDGVQLYGKTLNIEPKIRSDEVFKHVKNLRLFEEHPELFGHPRE